MSDRITITGRVATAPKRIERAGAPGLVTFRLATSDSRFDEAKNAWVESGTNWYTVNAWRALADNVEQSLQVGQQVLIRARLDLRTWQDDNGKERIEPTLHVDGIGHDLRRGVSSFTPTGGRTGDASRQIPAAQPVAEADVWHVPVEEGADLPF